MNSTKIPKSDLRFLLKDKYQWDEKEIEEFISTYVDYVCRAAPSGPSGAKPPLEFSLPLRSSTPNHSPHKLSKILNDISLLKKGIPLAYVIGYLEFLNCKIDLNYRPLIPRPETEFWVEKALKDINAIGREEAVLDLFSGSGCVGVAILLSNQHFYVTFADIDENCIKQIKHNLDINKIAKSRYEVVKSDIFSNIKGKYDYIFANPPYVGTRSEYKKEIFHEPSIALFASGDGLDIIRKFLAQAFEYLNANGKIFMEFGDNQKDEIEKMLKINKYSKWKFHKDQYDKWRWVEITK